MDIDLRPFPQGNFVSGITGFRIQGGASGDGLGRSAARIGDINGDGIDDFVVGAYLVDLNNAMNVGEVYVIFGKPTNTWSDIDLRTSGGNFISGTDGFKVTGMTQGDWLGIATSGLGDINGDGIGDFIIGARHADPNGLDTAGEAIVIFGKSSNTWSDIDLRTSGGNFVSGTTGFRIKGGAEGDWLGYSVSNLGDINGDGVNDFIIGNFMADANGISNAGEAIVIFGKSSNTWSDIDLRTSGGNFVSGTTGFKIKGKAEEDGLGVSVSRLGDINGDGVNDFIIGVTGASPNNLTRSGEGYIIFGKSSNTWSDIDLRTSGGNFVSGTTGFKITGGAANDYLGVAISSLGDINGDNISDFIITAFDPDGRSNPGKAYVIFGKSTNTWSDIDLRTSGGNFVSGTTGFKIDNDGDVFGVWEASNLGDINGDGINDFVVGDYIADHNDLDMAGEAIVIFGKSSNTWSDIDLRTSGGNFVSGTTGFRIKGGAEGDRLGVTISDVGDINGDNINDFIIGVIASDPNDLDMAGEAYVIFGQCLSENYELPNLSTFSRKICTESSNIIDLNDIVTDLTITNTLISRTGRIDLSGNYTTLTLNGATLEANDYTGTEINSIDLSGANALVFTGTNSLDSGSKGIALPSGFRISGNLPTIVGNVNYAVEQGDYIITAAPTYAASASGDITTNVDHLSLSTEIISTNGTIDLSGIGISLTLNGASLRAENYTGSGVAIDLSNIPSLIFMGTNNVLDAGTGYVLLPESSAITGLLPAVTGISCTDSVYQIEDDINPNDTVCYSGRIRADIGSGNLAINGDIISISSRIDLSDATGTITFSNATLKAENYVGTEHSINLSNVGNLVCNDSTLDAGENGTIQLPLESNIEMSNCQMVGNVVYATTPSNPDNPNDGGSDNSGNTTTSDQQGSSPDFLSFLPYIGGAVVGAFAVIFVGGFVYRKLSHRGGHDIPFLEQMSNRLDALHADFDVLDTIQHLDSVGE